MSLHVQRIGDEMLITVKDNDGAMVVALEVPDGVNELISALKAEMG